MMVLDKILIFSLFVGYIYRKGPALIVYHYSFAYKYSRRHTLYLHTCINEAFISCLLNIFISKNKSALDWFSKL